MYVEDAAANPWCVGTHWFTLYDQSALGRGVGENYNIGIMDVCNKPYEELVKVARFTHEKIYDIAVGKFKPHNNLPAYFQNLF